MFPNGALGELRGVFLVHVLILRQAANLVDTFDTVPGLCIVCIVCIVLVVWSMSSASVCDTREDCRPGGSPCQHGPVEAGLRPSDARGW